MIARVREMTNFRLFSNYSLFVPITLLLLFSLSFANCSKANSGAPSAEKVDRAVKAAAGYLIRSVMDSGRFIYQVNMDPSVKVPGSYNVLRHAGTIYSMCMYYDAFPEKEVREAILRSGEYFRKEFIAPMPRKPGMKGIGMKHAGKVKLGANGIGLLALMSIEKIKPGFTQPSELRSIAELILYLQKPDGSFYSRYQPAADMRDDSWTSLYYPGEAACGLLMLHEKYPDSRWIKSAAGALGYLAESRKGKRKVPPDHWALLATAKLFSLKDSGLSEKQRELIANHAVQVVRSMLAGQVSSSDSNIDRGFTRAGNTTSAACRMEGIIAVYPHLPETVRAGLGVRESCDRAVNFLLNAQVEDAKYRGAFPHSAGRSFIFSESSEKSGEIRIDYVQHALSAILEYREQFLVNADSVQKVRR